MIVYGSTLSPFVRKVLAFAAEKGVAIELRPGGMGQGGDDFAAASPFRKMPALRDPGAEDGRDFTLCDSSAIVTYIEAKHPAPALLPADPIGRARAIWFDEFADTILFGAARVMFFNRLVAPRFLKTPGDAAAADKAEREDLPPTIDYLETVAPEDGFLLGEHVTLADIAVASPFVNLAHVDWTVDAARWPRTAAYVARIHARPSFAPIIDKERAFIARAG